MIKPLDALIQKLRALKPGDRVRYVCWRGDRGDGVFLRFVSAVDGKEIDGQAWGKNRRDGIVVKRNFSADDGRIFLPFIGDGEEVIPLENPDRAPSTH